jgi:hypothetical protein
MASATTTAEQSPSKTKSEVIKEAQRLAESLLHSSKNHFEAARIFRGLHLWVGIPMVVLSATAGAAALSKFDPDRIIAGVLSIIVAVLSGVATFLNPNERVSAHLNAGNSYDSLLNRVRVFWTIECWQIDSDTVLTDRLRQFVEQKDDLNRKCPQIPRLARRRAKRAIESGDAEFLIDKESSGLGE